MDWIDLAQDRDRWQGYCECGNELPDYIKCGESLDYVRISEDSAPWIYGVKLNVKQFTWLKLL